MLAPATARPGFKDRDIMTIHAPGIQLDSIMLEKMELYASRALIIVWHIQNHSEQLLDLRLTFQKNIDARLFYEKILAGLESGQDMIVITDITPSFDREKYMNYIEEELMFNGADESYTFE